MNTANKNLVTVTVGEISVDCFKIEAVRVENTIRAYLFEVANIKARQTREGFDMVNYLRATDAAWERTIGAL